MPLVFVNRGGDERGQELGVGWVWAASNFKQLGQAVAGSALFEADEGEGRRGRKEQARCKAMLQLQGQGQEDL